MSKPNLSTRLLRSLSTWLGDWVIEHWPLLAITGGGGLMTYFASISQAMQSYGPLAWGAIGISSALILALIFTATAWAQKIRVRTKYDNILLESGSLVNPLDMTFERKRVLLNDFILPSHTFVDGKTFIECELIGPANIYLQYGNNIAQPIKIPKIDVVWLAPTAKFFNGITVTNCIFRNCSFQRITIFSGIENFNGWKDSANINWISIPPTQDQITERQKIIDATAASNEANPTETA